MQRGDGRASGSTSVARVDAGWPSKSRQAVNCGRATNPSARTGASSEPPHDQRWRLAQEWSTVAEGTPQGSADGAGGRAGLNTLRTGPGRPRSQSGHEGRIAEGACQAQPLGLGAGSRAPEENNRWSAAVDEVGSPPPRSPRFHVGRPLSGPPPSGTLAPRHEPRTGVRQTGSCRRYPIWGWPRQPLGQSRLESTDEDG